MTKRLFLILFALTTFVSYAYNTPPNKQFVVVLDAGHGGHDPGNRGNGLFEKTIALDIILKTGKILEKDPNIKVVYTRKSDVFVDLFKRGQIANKANADLFVSVHCNAHHTQAFGTETFVLGLHANNRNFNIAKKENSVILLEDNYEKKYNGFDPNSPESVIGLTITQEEYLEQSLNLASFVQNNFSKQLNRKNRGVKQAGFVVLHQTFMPSVLIETGFLSNKSEGQYLNSNKGKQQMANSIAKAIEDYKKSQESSFEPNIVKPELSRPNKSAPVVLNTPKVSVPKPVKTTPKIVQETPVKTVVKEVEKEVTIPKVTTPVVTQKDTQGILFRVQLAASKKYISPVAKNFKGVPTIEVLQIDDYYKYYFGKTSNYQNAKELQLEAKNIGFESCYVVAFENGTPIKLFEALKKIK